MQNIGGTSACLSLVCLFLAAHEIVLNSVILPSSPLTRAETWCKLARRGDDSKPNQTLVVESCV